MKNYVTLSLFGVVLLAVAVWRFRIASDIPITVDAGGMAVANASLMHQQLIAMMQALAAGIGSVIALSSATICNTIERP